MTKPLPVVDDIHKGTWPWASRFSSGEYVTRKSDRHRDAADIVIGQATTYDVIDVRLRALATEMGKQGFTVSMFSVNDAPITEEEKGPLVFMLTVSLVRAEEKIAGHDIIAAGPLVREEGMYPHRIVLRCDGTKYIIHTQGIPDGVGPAANVFFANGHYFDNRAKAMAKFIERVVALDRSANPADYNIQE